MWAQGLTVGTLISSALIAGVTTTDNKVVEGKIDHSWADILGKSISSDQYDKGTAADLCRTRGTDEEV